MTYRTAGPEIHETRPSGRDPHEERQVRHTVIRLIAAHLQPAAEVSWQTHHFDLTGAVLDGGDDFTGIEVTARTVLTLAGAKFTGDEVTFDWAKFTGGEGTFDWAKFAGGTVDLSWPRDWSAPPKGVDGSQKGVKWPSSEYLARIGKDLT
jgi:hypothetical protein